MRKIDLGLFAILACSACVWGCGPLADDPVEDGGGGGGAGSDAPTSTPSSDAGGATPTHDSGGGSGGQDGGPSQGGGEGGSGSEAGPSGDDSGPGSDDSGPQLVCSQAGAAWAAGNGISNTGWTATATPTPATDGTTSDGVTTNAFDNDISTRWSSGAAQVAGAGTYFLLDLGSAQSISQVALFYPGSGDAGTTDYPAAYSLGLSTSATGPFTTVASGTGGSPTVMCFAAQSAQYLKLTQTGTSGSWLSIYEIQVFH